MLLTQPVLAGVIPYPTVPAADGWHLSEHLEPSRSACCPLCLECSPSLTRGGPPDLPPDLAHRSPPL